jgi:hypothetical protein
MTDVAHAPREGTDMAETPTPDRRGRRAGAEFVRAGDALLVAAEEFRRARAKLGKVAMSLEGDPQLKIRRDREASDHDEE